MFLLPDIDKMSSSTCPVIVQAWLLLANVIPREDMPPFPILWAARYGIAVGLSPEMLLILENIVVPDSDGINYGWPEALEDE